jgi:hypothetical protein
MVRDESDVVGENVEDIRWSSLDSKVENVVIVQDGYLLSAFTHIRYSLHRLIPHYDAVRQRPYILKPDPSFQTPVSSIA